MCIYKSVLFNFRLFLNKEKFVYKHKLIRRFFFANRWIVPWSLTIVSILWSWSLTAVFLFAQISLANSSSALAENLRKCTQIHKTILRCTWKKKTNFSLSFSLKRSNSQTLKSQTIQIVSTTLCQQLPLQLTSDRIALLFSLLNLKPSLTLQNPY